MVAQRPEARLRPKRKRAEIPSRVLMRPTRWVPSRTSPLQMGAALPLP